MPRFAANCSWKRYGPGSTNPSMSWVVTPASAMACCEASSTRRSTDFWGPRVYAVSPTPTMHAWSRNVCMHVLLCVQPVFTAVNLEVFMLLYRARDRHATQEGQTRLRSKEPACTKNSFNFHRDARDITGPLAVRLSPKFCTRPSTSCKRPLLQRKLIPPFGTSMYV